MRVVRFYAENIKRLKAVEIVPKKDGAMIVVGGANDAGKSSVLDAIEMALGGKGSQPSEPLRRGSKKGRVVLDLGEIQVSRSFTAGGGSVLKVENQAGARFVSPQAVLEKLYSDLTFDPLSFERQKTEDQAAILRRLVPSLDFSALDTQRAEIYEERTQEGRAVKALQVTADASERYEEAPAQEVSIEALSEELEIAEGLLRASQRAAAASEAAKAQAAQQLAALARQEAATEALREELARAEDALAGMRKVAAALAAEDGPLRRAALAAEAAAEDVPDTAEIRARLKAAEAINLQVRTNRQHEAALAALAQAKARQAELTNRIDQIDTEKSERLAAAVYPVPGLGIDLDGQVMLNDLPFAQASTSDRIRVSVAMGLAMNPKLRILLVRDGSLLGEAKLKIIEAMAREADAQIWLEMQQEAPSGRTTIFIEDGYASKRKAPAAPQALDFAEAVSEAE